MWTKNTDKRLLILQVLYDLYQKNNITEIRRVKLKELCDNKLNEETEGEQDDYGGSFQRYLKELEDKGMLRCIQVGKKETTIIADVRRIEYQVQLKEINESLDKKDKKILQTSFEDSIWEELVEETFSSELDKIIRLKYNLNLAND